MPFKIRDLVATAGAAALLINLIACLGPFLRSNPYNYTFDMYDVQMEREADDAVSIEGVLECDEGDCGDELCVEARWYSYPGASELEPGLDGGINRPQGITENSPVFTDARCDLDVDADSPLTFTFTTDPAPADPDHVVELKVYHPDEGDDGPVFSLFFTNPE